MGIETLTLVGGHPALDLVNTLSAARRPRGRHRDHLATPEDVVVWARRIGLDAGSPDDAALLPAARAARGRAHGRPRSAGPAGGRRHGRAGGCWTVGRPPPRRRPGSGRPDAGLRREVGTDPAHRVEDQLALAAVDLLTGPDAVRIKRCPVEQGGCGWVFVDRSRNSSGPGAEWPTAAPRSRRAGSPSGGGRLGRRSGDRARPARCAGDPSARAGARRAHGRHVPVRHDRDAAGRVARPDRRRPRRVRGSRRPARHRVRAGRGRRARSR